LLVVVDPYLAGKDFNMTVTDKDSAHLLDQNYLDLAEYYVSHPIALYAGSGVSWSDNPMFGVGLWNDFIRRILLSDKNSGPEVVEEFDRCVSDWHEEPWEMAEWVANQVGYDAFQHYATALVQQEQNFQRKYKLLSGKFLENARTLNSIVAFCGEFATGKLTKDKKGQWTAIYERAVNRRVHAILTSNYDPFLEAASSTMFRKRILKPVAARGSSVGELIEIPVFHIHGYVPFPDEVQNRKGSTRVPLVDPVITTEDYEGAWKADDVYNFTMGPQIHILRHYTVLFIGFSFRDKWVLQLLKALDHERRERKDRLYHYAIMKKEEVAANGLNYFRDELGIKPISIDNFSEIKNLLSHLYQQGLHRDYPGSKKIRVPTYRGKRQSGKDKPVFLTPAEYFEELYECRLSMVRKKRAYTYSA
jgi:hypothetical protein